MPNLSYTIQTPKRVFADLRGDERADYITSISAAGNGDHEAASNARSMLSMADDHIRAVRELLATGDVVQYRLKYANAEPAVQAAVPEREDNGRYKFTKSVSVESKPYKAGDVVDSGEVPIGNLVSMLRVGYIEAV